MQFSNINFTGSRILEGTPNKVHHVGQEIKAMVGYYDGPSCPQNGDGYESVIIENNGKKMKALISTEEDSYNLKKFLETAENSGTANINKDQKVFSEYFQKNIGKFIDNLPKETINAEEVLRAIKDNVFDFAKLVINK